MLDKRDLQKRLDEVLAKREALAKACVDENRGFSDEEKVQLENLKREEERLEGLIAEIDDIERRVVESVGHPLSSQTKSS